MFARKWRSISKLQQAVGSGNFPQFFVSQRHKFDKREANLWSKTNTDRALDHFDDFYGTFYGDLWPATRLAMLSTPKHCALVNYYGDYNETIEKLKNMGCMDIQELFEQSRSKKTKTRKTPENMPTDVLEKEAGVEDEESENFQELTDDRVISPGQTTSAYLNFVPTTKLKGMEDWLEEEDQFEYVKPTYDFVVEKQKDERLDFPSLLKAFVFPRGDISRFPSPKKSTFGTSNYYLMDAASLLPVLALNLQPTESVLDLCAAPGGKSLAILQTLYPNRLVCNDITISRISRLNNVLKQYLGQTQTWKEHLEVRKSDALHWSEFDAFDKVLVDVPCTNDRHSVMEDDNNYFKKDRMKERISLPETQSALLCAGVRACKPGGTIVYSTCSLSPIQNDGVVHMAIKQLKEMYKIDTVVKDMSMTAGHFRFLCRFAPSSSLRYGQVALPSIVNNFGPMYISKLQRVI
ncbi:5-methylcytosine rRNA methyltransferase NSUN4-like [Daphnia pulex]|uniref:5-methylcytosine rRNA methyltransferase NSUN4-like n=1 Tax=Daphnia pulex TaxID=6669 RepID=UPI001EDE9C46|nr:5-methylcytosine rRNA methyltransferase NSUN4-like [Daphnia pulex]